MRQVAGYKALQVDDHFFAKSQVQQASLRSKLKGRPAAAAYRLGLAGRRDTAIAGYYDGSEGNERGLRCSAKASIAVAIAFSCTSGRVPNIGSQ